eukprot:8366094-Pyramimonas_sp.AAC.3
MLEEWYQEVTQDTTTYEYTISIENLTTAPVQMTMADTVLVATVDPDECADMSSAGDSYEDFAVTFNYSRGRRGLHG